MRVVIAYESMYGNTRRVAEAIAAGFPADDEVNVGPVSRLGGALQGVDLLVIGVPTHAHSMPRPSTRKAAIDGARTKRDEHVVETSAAGTGVREWLQALPSQLPLRVAAYDTRFPPPGWVVGHPARTVSRLLAQRGATVVARPMSFFVDKTERLRIGEPERAEAWGRALHDAVAFGQNRAAQAPAT